MKNKIYSIVAAAALLGATSVQAAPIQFGGTGNWYEIVGGSFLFSEAEADAATKSFGGETGALVTITTQEEQDFLNIVFGAMSKFWIGASDAASEGTFTWIDGDEDGQALVYDNFAPGQPTNSFAGQDAVVMLAGTGQWSDVNGENGNHRYAYIVEYSGTLPPVPLPAGLPLAAGAFGLLAFARRRKAKKS